MPDREKVIKGLRDAIRYLEDKEWSDEKASEHVDALIDALALLKEQEAVKPHKGKNPEESAFDCGACGYPLWEDEKYCAHCGKSILWEGR